MLRNNFFNNRRLHQKILQESINKQKEEQEKKQKQKEIQEQPIITKKYWLQKLIKMVN